MKKQDDGTVKIPLIGLLAVKNLLITKEELQAAMVQCKDADNLEFSLKEYLLSNEMISEQNIQRLLKAAKALEIRQKEFKFGIIAVRKGFINQSVLKLALEEQENDIKTKKKVRMIGDLLVEAGMLTDEQRNYILNLQKRVRQEVTKTQKDGIIPDAKEKFGSDGLEENKNSDGNEPDVSITERTTVSEKSEDAQDKVTLMEPEILDGGIKLEISSDYMAAFLTKLDYFDKNITPVKIKEVLFEKGISMGVVEDKMIEGFIESSGFKTKSFMVARGIVPIDGKDARIEYFFNTDYLSAGGVTEDGSIDFKERGKIPHVEEGTVLAEKIPMVEARRGHSIFGDEIETVEGSDIFLKCGKGAKLSEDGFKVMAAVKGFPKYSLSGQVFVHQEYVAKGDVDFETGHINYDGNVKIKGRIKSGFKVQGNDIQAIELDGGEIDAQGNVKITGGINEGKIYSRGSIYAKFIHKSEIVCMGDVLVEKEIVDSDVECSGACSVEYGKLISSRLTAKMGLKAKNIGTEMTAPNIIKVGHDAFLEKELKENTRQIEEYKKQMEEHKKKIKDLKQENLDLQQRITDLAHVQDRSQLEEREIASKIAAMENESADLGEISELKIKIEQLETAAQKAEKDLDACFDRSEKIEMLVEEQNKKIADLEKQKELLLEEKSNLIEWASENPGKPEVIVTGAAMPETVIRGRHCEKRITEVTRHAKFSEILCRGEDGNSLNIYEISTGNI